MNASMTLSELKLSNLTHACAMFSELVYSDSHVNLFSSQTLTADLDFWFLFSRSSSRRIIPLRGSVLSIHSRDPRLFVMGTIPKVFSLRFLLWQAESSLKIPLTMWNIC